MNRVAIAQNTLDILNAGYYHLPTGEKVSIGSDLATCLAQTRYYNPDTLAALQIEVLASSPTFSKTEFIVRNETTLTGGARISSKSTHQTAQKIGILNFASAKNPGGGFLRGAQAQEESLARSSALYSSLLKCPEQYEFHHQQKDLLYSDGMIYSPNCPVFKTDRGDLLKTPYLVDFITSPAPNAGEVAKQQPQDLSKLRDVLYKRGAKVLTLAAYHQCDVLILGAWGCGVFRNDPTLVAQMFADFLLPGKPFYGRFQTVLFSVLDTSASGRIFNEFQARFS